MRTFKDPDIPGQSRDAHCSRVVDQTGKKCGAVAHNFVVGQVAVMDKSIQVKVPVCDAHLSDVRKDDNSYLSIATGEN